MVRVMGVYRWVEGASFDHTYYNAEHMRLTRTLLAPEGLLRLESDRHIAGEPPPPGSIIAASHAYFPSMEAAQRAVAVAGPTLMADVRRYTTLKPELSFALIESHD